MSDRLDDLDPFDTLLRARLERLTAAIPVDATGEPARAPRRRSLRVVLLAATMVTLLSLGAVAAYVWIGRPQVASGAFGAGGPLHCSGVDQLSPPEAERWLSARGFETRWQVETGGAGPPVMQEEPPDHGSIMGALALADGQIVILVDLSHDQPLPPKPCP